MEQTVKTCLLCTAGNDSDASTCANCGKLLTVFIFETVQKNLARHKSLGCQNQVGPSASGTSTQSQSTTSHPQNDNVPIVELDEDPPKKRCRMRRGFYFCASHATVSTWIANTHALSSILKHELGKIARTMLEIHCQVTLQQIEVIKNKLAARLELFFSRTLKLAPDVLAIIREECASGAKGWWNSKYRQAKKVALRSLELQPKKVRAKLNGQFSGVDYRAEYNMSDSQFVKFSEILLSLFQGEQPEGKAKARTKRTTAQEQECEHGNDSSQEQDTAVLCSDDDMRVENQ